MGFNRLIFRQLEDWKNNKERKPLIIRGARQVGKTTLVEDFAKTYPYSILLNLEKHANKAFFEELNDAKSIVEALLLNNIFGYWTHQLYHRHSKPTPWNGRFKQCV